MGNPLLNLAAARGELARRSRAAAPVGLFWRIVLTPLFLALTAILMAATPALCRGLRWDSPVVLAFLGGLAGGVMLFCRWRLTGLYVLCHELTHWLAAKCCLRRTGKISLGWRNGYVEVPEPNAFIVLAPYCFPTLFFFSAGLFALAALFWEAHAIPHWCALAGAGWMGLCAAYHLVLTMVALRAGQSDIRYCGAPLSFAIILFGNCAFFYLSLVIAAGQWQTGYAAPVKIAVTIFWRILTWVKTLAQ